MIVDNLTMCCNNPIFRSVAIFKCQDWIIRNGYFNTCIFKYHKQTVLDNFVNLLLLNSGSCQTVWYYWILDFVNLLDIVSICLILLISGSCQHVGYCWSVGYCICWMHLILKVITDWLTDSRGLLLEMLSHLKSDLVGN